MSTHALLVIVGGSPRATETTVEILSFFKEIKPWLTKMGVQVRIQKITPAEIKAGLGAKLARKNITNIPAAIIPKPGAKSLVLQGIKRITEVYADRVIAFKKFTSSGGGGRIETDDDPYRAFIDGDIDIERASEDKDDVIGEGGSEDMMRRLQDEVKRRTQFSSQFKSQRPSKLPAAPPRPPSSANSGNPLVQDSLSKVLAESGSAENPNDDVLSMAFWENQMDSEML